MASKQTQKCVEFVRKLAALYEASQMRQDIEPVLENDSRLAEWLGKPKSLISTWRQGNTTKNRSVGEVMPTHLVKLAERYCALSGGRVSKEEALQLWALAPYEFFRRRLFQAERSSIIRVLEENPTSLEFQLNVMGDDLSLIETDARPEGDEIGVPFGSYFSLSVTTRLGRSLVSLGMNWEGLTLLSPGPQHDGRVNSAVESLPRDSSWKFNTSGPCRIMIIELPVALPPICRGRYESHLLSESQELNLVEELLDVERSDGWRWAEKRIYIAKPTGGAVD